MQGRVSPGHFNNQLHLTLMRKQEGDDDRNTFWNYVKLSWMDEAKISGGCKSLELLETINVNSLKSDTY